jgi:hypothetical protein
MYESLTTCRDSSLRGCRVVRRSAQARVADEHLLAIDAVVLKNSIEQSARRSSERYAGTCFLHTGGFPHNGKFRLIRASAWYILAHLP